MQSKEAGSVCYMVAILFEIVIYPLQGAHGIASPLACCCFDSSVSSTNIELGVFVDLSIFSRIL